MSRKRSIHELNESNTPIQYNDEDDDHLNDSISTDQTDNSEEMTELVYTSDNDEQTTQQSNGATEMDDEDPNSDVVGKQYMKFIDDKTMFYLYDNS